MEIKKLQTMIDARAEKRLDADLLKIWEALTRLLPFDVRDILTGLFVVKGETKVAFRDAIWHPNNGIFYETIKELMLPKYKQEEASNFIKQVENLTNDVSEIKDELSNIPY